MEDKAVVTMVITGQLVLIIDGGKPFNYFTQALINKQLAFHPFPLLLEFKEERTALSCLNGVCQI